MTVKVNIIKQVTEIEITKGLGVVILNEDEAREIYHQLKNYFEQINYGYLTQPIGEGFISSFTETPPQITFNYNVSSEAHQ